MALHIFRAILRFIAEILLDLDLLNGVYTKRCSGLTVDYGEYFKLTVDFYFDCGRCSEYRL